MLFLNLFISKIVSKVKLTFRFDAKIKLHFFKSETMTIELNIYTIFT